MKPTLYKILPPVDGVYLVNSKNNEPPVKCLVKDGRAYDDGGEVLNFDCYWEYVGAVTTWPENA